MADEVASPPRRQYTQRETRLRSEYLALAYPHARILINPRLGPAHLDVGASLPADVSPKILQGTQMYADAAIVLPGEVMLWEFKIVLDGRAIGQLLEYADSWADSPDYNELRGMPVSLHICTAAARRTAMNLARRNNIDVVLYSPAWAMEMIAGWYFNLSRPIQGGSARVTG